MGHKVSDRSSLLGVLANYTVLIPRHAAESHPSLTNALNYGLHGRACFSSGQYTMAIGFYGFALEYFNHCQVPVLLSNRAACYLLWGKYSRYFF